MVAGAKIRVLVVDDSALMRSVLTHILEQAPQIEIVGEAADPYEAWSLIQAQSPDVITLDVEMPRMDGVTFLTKLMRRRPIPVVMISTLTQQGAEVTFRALEAGAVDFVAKPTANLAAGTIERAAEIIEKVIGAASARVAPIDRPAAPPAPPAAVLPIQGGEAPRTIRMVALGASTGGTEALSRVIRALAPPFPPTVIVQHMPSPFTTTFAGRLNGLGPMTVVEATDGLALKPGLVVLAHGSYHLRVRKMGSRLVTQLDEGPPVSRHRPSVDVLFDSVAKVAGRDAVGVILTGMGRDGAAGLKAMRAAGALTLGQDQASSVVYGMPRAAFEEGGVMRQLSLDCVGPALNALVERSREREAVHG